MIALDTTVLIYATGSQHPLREPCRRLVDAVADGLLTASTTVEVIQEFTHVRARRTDRGEASLLAGSFTDLLAPLLPVGEAALRHGLRIYIDAVRLGAFDAVLAAAAMAAEADALVSADGAFAEVPGLRHLLPDDDGIAALLPASHSTTAPQRYSRDPGARGSGP